MPQRSSPRRTTRRELLGTLLALPLLSACGAPSVAALPTVVAQPTTTAVTARAASALTSSATRTSDTIATTARNTPVATASTTAGSARAVTLAWWYNYYAPAESAWKQTLQEFQAQHPTITVTMTPAASSTTEQLSKLEAAAAGGSPPDVVYIHPIYNAAVADKGIIVPLDPYVAQNSAVFNLADFYAGTVDYFRWKDKLWSLPNYSGPGVFYYNTDLLNRQGLADPWALFQKGQWTTQQMDDDVAKLTSGQGTTKVFGRSDISRSVRFQSPWIQGFGGQVWTSDVTQTLLAGAGAVQAWQYLANQLLKGAAPGSADLKGVANGAQGLFTSGHIVFYFGIRSEVTAFKNLSFGTVPLHKMPDGKYYNRDGPNGLSITQGSKYRDDAWLFMTYDLTRGVELAMGTGFTAPTTRTLAKSPLWRNRLVPGENADAYAAAAEQVQAIPLPPRMTDIDTLVEDAFAKLVAGQATAQDAMSAVAPQVNALLASS